MPIDNNWLITKDGVIIKISQKTRKLLSMQNQLRIWQTNIENN